MKYVPRKAAPPNAREPQTELGRRIRKRRLELNLSQGFVAMRLSVMQPVISQWELGDSKPRGERLRQLADALDTTVEWLLEGT